MIRALWFFCQIAIVIAALIWISTQQGAVDIAWRDYELDLNLGVFLLGTLAVVLVGLAVLKLISYFVDLPNRVSRRNAQRAQEKGYQSLTRGFVAIAAGDAKKATQYAKEVRHLLPNDTGLPLLLEAQAARLRGEDHVARHAFEQLLGDKDAAFFGIRGLLKSSLDAGDKLAALEYAKGALTQNPKQPWVIKAVYDLELQNAQWRNAYDMLPRVRKARAVEEEQLVKDETSLLLILADDYAMAGLDGEALKKAERAVKLNPTFVPAVLHLAEMYQERGKTGKIAGLVERAWRANPHPELAVWWDKVAPQNKASDASRRLRWHEKLVAMRPDSADAQLAAAMVAMEDGLWGEAKTYLQAAETLRPTAQVYRLRAKLEEETTRDQYLIKTWLEKAADAAPDAVWYDTLTGNIYERWSPIALPQASFNTIEWGHPALPANQNLGLRDWKDPLMIEGAL